MTLDALKERLKAVEANKEQVKIIYNKLVGQEELLVELIGGFSTVEKPAKSSKKEGS